MCYFSVMDNRPSLALRFQRRRDSLPLSAGEANILSDSGTGAITCTLGEPSSIFRLGPIAMRANEGWVGSRHGPVLGPLWFEGPNFP